MLWEEQYMFYVKDGKNIVIISVLIYGYWYFAERNGTERNQLRGPKRGNKIYFKRHYFNLTYRKWKIVLQILLF